MMIGRVSHKLEPKLNLWIYNSHGGNIQVEALIDTGCTLALVLNVNLIEQILRLEYLTEADVEQGDGSTSRFPVYVGQVEWKGTLRTVNIVGLGKDAIIGMEMLRDCNWQMDVRPNGTIVIT